MRIRATVLAVTAVSVQLLVASPSTAEVVYDSLTGFEYNGGRGCCSGTGQTVALTGTSRNVTKLDVWFGTGGPSTFTAEFYKLDGPSSVPGSLIWKSPVQTYPYVPPYYNRQVISIDIPNVLVPDTFAWTLTNVVRENDTLLVTQPTTSIGTTLDSWHYSPTSGWGHWDDIQFGARIHAVPEPTSASLVAMGMLILCHRMRLPLKCWEYFTGQSGGRQATKSSGPMAIWRDPPKRYHSTNRHDACCRRAGAGCGDAVIVGPAGSLVVDSCR
jgi:hypothetical protein